MKLSPAYFSLIALALFCCDIGCLAFFEQPYSQILYCLYIALLYSSHPGKKIPLFWFIITGLLLGLQALVVYDQLLFAGILIPLAALARSTQQKLNAVWLHPYLLLGLSLFIIYPTTGYTALKIIANIVILWCIMLSLKKYVYGRYGNRF